MRELLPCDSSPRACDVVLYQAGADAHIDDPLGGFLTTSQLLQRDHLVFEGSDNGAPPLGFTL